MKTLYIAVCVSSLLIGAGYPGPEHYAESRPETCTDKLQKAGFYPEIEGSVYRYYAPESEYWTVLNLCDWETMTPDQHRDSYENLHDSAYICEGDTECETLHPEIQPY